MAGVSWFIRRLGAMSFPEVIWRLSQKKIQKQEEKQFGEKKISVLSHVFNASLTNLQPHPDRLKINYGNGEFSLNTSIHLLAGADYNEYRKKWNAGFQTKNTWPDKFSHKLEYKQRDDIGDARTNWELNRHFQFALLAKDYAACRDERYLYEFEDLFSDWNEKNPFLHGISWTSVMEIAIRCSNWCYAYAFLEHAGATGSMLDKLIIGIINMTDYIANHYSRYSSANNHLIVEAYALGQSGILFDNKEWTDLAVRLLTEELSKQNYSDGVNKELSLHYQAFYMEAMGLMMRLMVKNGLDVPEAWKLLLQKMSRYVADCIGDYGEIIAFGDDDEGKILDLHGEEINYYQYVLGMMSLLLDIRYVKDFSDETIGWIFDRQEIEAAKNKDPYVSPQNCCYRKGGNTILRSKDRKVLIGIDHAALGFGSIAAHGHADALSFQLFYEGNPVFIDPGTYIYHCDLEHRNALRKTRNHNTVCVDGKDQSEMLGAFLWGHKANSKLLIYEETGKSVKLVMQHDGYAPIIHRRTIEFDGDRNLRIADVLSRNARATAAFVLSPNLDCKITHNKAVLSNGTQLLSTSEILEESCEISGQYGIKEMTKVLVLPLNKDSPIEIKI